MEEGKELDIEEVRLALLGGEEVINVDENKREKSGFSSWLTVLIRSFTSNKEEKDERARAKIRKSDKAKRIEE